MSRRIYFILILNFCLIASITGSKNQPQAQSLFGDVPEGHWAYDYVMAIYDAGITAGCSQSPLMYCPEENVTREQMAVFITRAMNEVPGDGYCEATDPFTDVAFDRWSCKYIKRLAELGITTGYGEGRFGPEDSVTREQMAVFLTRALNQVPADGYCGTTSPFTDVPYDWWSCKYIKMLSDLGLSTGYGDGRFGPEDYVTRAQMAVFLSRAFLGTNPNAELSGQYFQTYYGEITETLPPNIPTRTIIVDGNTNDWAGINPLITDGSGNNWSGPGAASGTDITGLYLAKDSTYLYFRSDLADGPPNPSGIRYRVYISNSPTFPLPYLYMHGIYNSTLSQWETVLYSWDGTTATQIGPTNIAAAGASSIEMRMPISQFGQPLGRWYIQGGTRSPVFGGTSFNLDLTDLLEARFQDIPNVAWKECGFATFTFDGKGGFTVLGREASNALGADYPTSGSGTYTVNSDGTVTMSGFGMDGWKFGIQKGGKMLLGGVTNNADRSQGIGFLFKKGGTHSLADSHSYSVSYNKDNNSQSCNLATVDIDAQGNVYSSGSNNNSSSGLNTFNISGTYNGNTDGSGITTLPSSWNAGSIGPPLGSPKYIPYAHPGATRDDSLFSSSVQLNNQNRGRQRVSANIKKPTTAQSNDSLVGDFFLARYVDQGGVRTSLFGTITFDGAGVYTMSGTSSTSDRGGNQPSVDSGTYSYDPATGTFLIQSNSNNTQETLVLNEEGDIALATNIIDPSYQGIGVMVKIR